MKKFKALYKAMYDDLKDSEMMIKYACDIREENPEASLTELCQICQGKISRSGLNHRLKKIIEFADEQKEKINK